MITTEQIKELRDDTGVSVMQCKKALEEARGDMEQAKLILRKTAGATADKKQGRTLGSGTVASYIHSDGTVGTIVELLCETDFVARNEEFKSVARDIAMHITAMNPETIEDLLDQEFIKDTSKTIRNLVEEVIQKFGEKSEIGKFARFGVK